MTITENGRVEVDEETLAKARAFLSDVGGSASKREMQKHLGKRWDVVNEVLTRLGDEARLVTQKRHREARATIRRLPSRKRSGSTRPIRSIRFPTVNEITLPITPTSVSEPEFKAIPLTVQKHPAVEPATVNEKSRRRPKSWPLIVLTFPAMVAIWGGWVDMGRLTGFGVVHPFPGIPGLDDVAVNLAITLPVSLETYAAYALYVWLSGAVPPAARTFACRSAVGALVLGAAGQVAYHLMVAAGVSRAPWWITTVVACLPVAVLGMGATLRHLVHAEEVNE
jgi:hypothetical protein